VTVVIEDPTPPPRPRPVVPLSRTPSPDEVRLALAAHQAQIEEHREAFARLWPARDITDRLGRLDRTLEKLDERFDRYAERVVRAEHAGDAAWDAVKDLGPQLMQVVAIGGDVKRMAESMDRVSARFDVLDRRLSGVETEQQLAAQKFEAHDQRDQKMEQALGRVEIRVGAVEHQLAIADNTAKVVKHRDGAIVRLWLPVTKGIGAVLVAIAAAIGVVYAAGGGCS
jgi:chromosome segregation ATPase